MSALVSRSALSITALDGVSLFPSPPVCTRSVENNHYSKVDRDSPAWEEKRREDDVEEEKEKMMIRRVLLFTFFVATILFLLLLLLLVSSES